MFQKTAAGQREVLRRQHNDGAEGQFPGDDDGHRPDICTDAGLGAMAAQVARLRRNSELDRRRAV